MGGPSRGRVGAIRRGSLVSILSYEFNLFVGADTVCLDLFLASILIRLFAVAATNVVKPRLKGRTF